MNQISSNSEPASSPNPKSVPKKKRSAVLTIIGILVALIVAFAVFVAMQPASFRVARSVKIEAPVAVIFPHVNDLHQWNGWSPWEKIDPAMKKTFEGPESGEGAIYRWDGNSEVGEGSNTIVKSDEDHRIRMKLEMKRPFEATNDVEFAFVPSGDETAVTWSMEGQLNFIGKAMHLFLDMDKMVGGQFEKGLNQLKAVSEAEQPEKDADRKVEQ